MFSNIGIQFIIFLGHSIYGLGLSTDCLPTRLTTNPPGSDYYNCPLHSRACHSNKYKPVFDCIFWPLS